MCLVLEESLSNLRAAASTMRELGIEEWDPLSGRIRLFHAPPARSATLTPEERAAQDAEMQRLEEVRAESDRDAIARRYAGASGGIRPVTLGTPPAMIRRTR